MLTDIRRMVLRVRSTIDVAVVVGGTRIKRNEWNLNIKVGRPFLVSSPPSAWEPTGPRPARLTSPGFRWRWQRKEADLAEHCFLSETIASTAAGWTGDGGNRPR